MSNRSRPKLPRKKVMIRFFEELIYSGAIWLALFKGGIDSERYVVLTGAWIAMSLVTAVAGYAGQLVRLECKDMRFMWYSLHRKIPDWVLWTFWPILAAVLLSPLFAVFVYISVGLAFYRGFWFRCHCMGYRAITFVDVILRAVAGFIVIS